MTSWNILGSLDKSHLTEKRHEHRRLARSRWPSNDIQMLRLESQIQSCELECRRAIFENTLLASPCTRCVVKSNDRVSIVVKVIALQLIVLLCFFFIQEFLDTINRDFRFL